VKLDFIRANTLTDSANISAYWVENWNYDVISRLYGVTCPRVAILCGNNLLKRIKRAIQGLAWLQHERTVSMACEQKANTTGVAQDDSTDF